MNDRRASLWRIPPSSCAVPAARNRCHRKPGGDRTTNRSARSGGASGVHSMDFTTIDHAAFGRRLSPIRRPTETPRRRRLHCTLGTNTRVRRGHRGGGHKRSASDISSLRPTPELGSSPTPCRHARSLSTRERLPARYVKLCGRCLHRTHSAMRDMPIRRALPKPRARGLGWRVTQSNPFPCREYAQTESQIANRTVGTLLSIRTI